MRVRRVVAASHSAALEADPQMEPGVAGRQACLTSVDGRRQLLELNPVHVCTASHGVIVSCARPGKALVFLRPVIRSGRINMRSVLVAAFAAALLAGAVGIAQAGEDRARGSAETQIVHESENNVRGDKWKFFGHLESSNANCLANRVVKMFKKENGRFVFADKDTTNGSGSYVTTARLPGEPALKFTVKQKEINGVTCGGDSIKPFSGP
jgi:hypothetical protein